MLAGFLFAALSAAGINNPLATRTYPVTYQMLEFASAGFFIFAVAIIIFYSGELVWRERDAQLNQVIDALPLQRWVLFCSKLLALMLVQVIIVFLIMASGVVRAGSPRLPPLPVQPVFAGALPRPAARALHSVRAGDVRADHRQQQVSRPLRDGVVRHRDHRSAARGLPGFPLPFRPDTTDYLLRHQRLRSLPAAAHLVPCVLDHRSDFAGNCDQPFLGARYGEQLASAYEPGRSSIFTHFDCRCQPLSGADGRYRQLHFLQHAHSQSVPHD